MVREAKDEVDVRALREFLQLAIETIEPDDKIQRTAFAEIFPELFGLRMNGNSFAQITSSLAASGFCLRSSTVRSYYNEMLAEKMELAEKQWDVQIARLRKDDAENLS